MSAATAIPTKETPALTMASQPAKDALAPSSFEIGGAAGGINPFLTLPSGAEQAADVKSGYVMRKSCFDAQGKKTKMGKRSWRMYFVTLREMVLYCFKDEKSLRSPGAFEDPSNAIRLVDIRYRIPFIARHEVGFLNFTRHSFTQNPSRLSGACNGLHEEAICIPASLRRPGTISVPGKVAINNSFTYLKPYLPFGKLSLYQF